MSQTVLPDPTAGVRTVGAPMAAARPTSGSAMVLHVPQWAGITMAVVFVIFILLGVWMAYRHAHPRVAAATLTSSLPRRPAPGAGSRVGASASGGGGLVEELDESQALALLKGEGAPAVLMVYAPWCGACKAARPHVDAAAPEAACRLFIVDGGKANSLRAQYGVTAYPTFIGVRADGKLSRLQRRSHDLKQELKEFADALRSNTAA